MDAVRQLGFNRK